MSAPTTMPAHNECNAPKWDSRHEDRLPTFFKDFEIAAEAAQIDKDHSKMKTEALHYIDMEARRFWKTLPSFQNTTKTWEDFKKEVISNYPDAKEEPNYNLEDLKKVVTSYSKSSISSLKEMANFHRKFNTVVYRLLDENIIAEVQADELYISVFTEKFREQLNVQLRLDHGKKARGKQYTQTQIKETVDEMLSDSPQGISVDKSPSSMSSITAVKQEPDMNDILSKMSAMLNKVLQVQSSSPSSSPSGSDCPDLKSWINDGKVEFSPSSYIVLKGGKKLPDEPRFSKGQIKKRFEHYFNENPSENALLYELTSAYPSLGPELIGIKYSTHSLSSLRGEPTPTSTVKTLALIRDDVNKSDPVFALANELALKVETRKSAQGKTIGKKVETTSPDPAPSVPISNAPQLPSKPTKPVIGKLPPNYVPPSERTLGAPSRDDVKNYHFWALIETENSDAASIVAKDDLDSVIPIRKWHLLALALEYRKLIKESVTGKRVGADGNLLKEVEPTFLSDSTRPTPVPPSPEPDPLSIYLQDFSNAKEGDPFYVAKESFSI
ncbi:hypothetical protein GYMLUDRAFT_251425 [Collybiopsis luxurians FD-317 M1]|uniref:Retrotransposon gag domain-containing protein n=1 Tax=Collybiopsis luxurians FD-317 M1 TaxID=944289 RepID=A0A0D0CBD2_9AGAR|nr:hypothetical protein GYMLUDRAFT_251425 [Collybiopsis luxurians FD-317 M1]